MDYKPMSFAEDAKTLMKEVCKNTAVRVRNSNGVELGDANVAYTITVTFLEELARSAGEKFRSGDGQPVSVELHKFMTLTIANRESNDGEKDGNIVPILTPGESCKLRVKNDGETENAED